MKFIFSQGRDIGLLFGSKNQQLCFHPSHAFTELSEIHGVIRTDAEIFTQSRSFWSQLFSNCSFVPNVGIHKVCSIKK